MLDGARCDATHSGGTESAVGPKGKGSAFARGLDDTENQIAHEPESADSSPAHAKKIHPNEVADFGGGLGPFLPPPSPPSAKGLPHDMGRSAMELFGALSFDGCTVAG